MGECTLHDLRDTILTHLRQTCYAQSPLLRLWAVSYVEGSVLVLPAEAATEFAEADPGGYHIGVWKIATEYETFLAQALLTNSNPRAHGYQQPKSFSAWPRRHYVCAYRRASSFRAQLPGDVWQTLPADRQTYLHLMLQWHQSTSYISRISGHTRLDQHHLEQLHRAILLNHMVAAWGCRVSGVDSSSLYGVHTHEQGQGQEQEQEQEWIGSGSVREI